MSEENEVVEEEKVVEVTRLCKGNMPMALVWFIKFHEDQENKSAVAKKYFTTPGKVSDIQGNSNQKYIIENMSWSDEDLASAKEQVEANFVRGQDDETLMANPEANKRRLATTTAEDAEYSLGVLDEIAGMTFDSEAITLAEARSTWNAEHPRKSKAKAETGEPTVEEVVTEEVVTEEDEDSVEDLLS